MKQTLQTKSLLTAILLFVFSLSAMAQLNLTATGLSGACDGAGRITFSVTGNNPAATITYTVYAGSNTSGAQVGFVTQIPTDTPPFELLRVNAGTYTVQAVQRLGSEVVTSNTVTVTISTTTATPTYSPDIQGTRCTDDGKVVINTLTGTPISYQLYRGDNPTGTPIATTLYPDNKFENLAIGRYTVVVTDFCGATTNVTVPIIQETTNLRLDPVVWPVQAPIILGQDWSLVDCDHVAPQHRIYTEGQQNIFYPITIKYTVTSPDGVVQEPVFQTIEDDGSNDQSFRSVPLKYYPCRQFSYTMEATDACGTVTMGPPNIFNQCFEVSWSNNYGHCDEKLTFTAKNYAPPFVVDFTSSTVPGFNPLDHNPDHPNHAGPDAEYKNHVPDGTYSAVVSNCGQSVTFPVIIMDKPEQELILQGTIGCGETTGTIAGDGFTRTPTDLVHVTLIPPYPAEYTGPTNLDAGIRSDDPSKFSLSGFPEGTYIIRAESECPNEFRETRVTMQRIISHPTIQYTSRAGCQEGYGSIWIRTNPQPPAGELLYGLSIQSGPPAWEAANPGARPVDYAEAVNANGMLYLNGLPEGDYIFNVVDACGPVPYPMTITGYHNIVRTATVDVNCVTFEVTIDVQGDNGLSPSYWLQKKDGDNWVHPTNGTVYPVGETPSNANSVRLTGPSENNGVYTPGRTASSGTGDFRVIQVFSIFGTGVSTGERCVTELATFRSGIAPEITGVFSFPCSENSGEVIVNAIFSGPPEAVRYRVDNEPFQESNVFTGLLPNVDYTFTVKDLCNTTNSIARIQDAPPLVIARTGDCDGAPLTLSLPEFNFLEYEWYNVAAPTVILSTTGTLTFPSFNSAVNAGTYEVRIVNPTNATSCLNQTLPYTIAPNVLPNAGADNITQPAVCTGSVDSINLSTYLVAPFDPNGTFTLVSGTGGALSGSDFDIRTITTGGTYDFNYTVSNLCGNSATALLRVTLLESPAAATIDPVSVQCEGTTVQLVATSTTTTPGLVYSWTGPNGFTFTGATASITNAEIADSGNYTVVVSNGICSSPPATISVTVTAAPNAGGNQTTTVCNTVAGTLLTLVDYLGTPHDDNGTWTLAATNTPPLSSYNDISNEFNTAGLFGTYDFVYTVEACGTQNSAVISFVLNAIPDAPVVTVDAATVCENGTIQLRTDAVTGATYAWTGPNGFTSSVQEPIVPATLAAAGDYTLTISTAAGCSAISAPIAVVVTPLPQFSLTGNTVICPTQFTTLSVTPGNFGVGDTNITYQWTLDGNVVSNTNTARVDQLGEYLVTVSNGSCTSPAQPITVTADPDPFTVTLQGDCVNEHFILSISNLTEIGTTQSIVWTGPGTSDATNSPTLDLVGKDAGTYEVVVTNADGCFKQASIVVETTDCKIPKGISPNGDAFNNEFDLTNLKVQNLQIFNRYGLQVYEKNNYTKEWYGQSDKGDLPTGTYFYVAKMADRQVTGWVYIQREQ